MIPLKAFMKNKNSFFNLMFKFLLLLLFLINLGCAGVSEKKPPDTTPEQQKRVSKKETKEHLDINLPVEIDEDTKVLVYEAYTGWVLCELENRRKEGLPYLKRLTQLVPESGYFWSILAQEYFREGKREDGMDALNNAMEVSPNSAEAHLLMGDVHRMENNDPEALKEFQKVLELEPNNLKALQELAAIYFDKKEYKNARKIYNTLLEIDPSSAPIYYHNVGQCLYNDGNYEEAKDFFLKVIEVRPYYINTYFSLGQIYEKLDENEKAIETYEQLLQYKPNYSEAHKKLGVLYYNSQQYTKALQEFIFVVRSDPYYYPAKKYLGILLIFRGDYNLASEYLDIYLENNGTDVEANYYRALAAEQLNQTELAKNLFEKILSLDPDHVDSYLHLADFAFRDKDFDRVIFLLNNAEPLDATNENIYYYRGIAYKFKEEYQKAEMDLYRAMELAENDNSIILQLALLYDETDQIDKAEKILLKYINTNPDQADGYNFLGYLFAERGIRLEEAERLIEKALKLNPESGDIVDSMGWVYYQTGRYQEALEMLEKALLIKGDEAVILEHLGDTYQKLEEKEKAIGAYKKALEIADEKELIEEKLQKLQNKVEFE